MTAALPSFLVTELRTTFRQCAQQHKYNRVHRFSSSHSVLLQPSKSKHVSRSERRTKPISNEHNPQDEGSKKPEVKAPHLRGSKPATSKELQTHQSLELVPQRRDGRAIGSRRTVDAPIKIIPKAEITPTLKLTPKERLHIEILTRRAPPVVKQIKPYKERLMIYHHGNLRENATIWFKFFGLVCAGFATFIVVPAHYSAGSSLLLCGSLVLAGWFPCVFFHNLMKGNVTRIHLRLPPNARLSPESAMKYAKNLPSTAQLDISFTRITALPGTITATLADLQPIPATSQRLWGHTNIRWVSNNVDRGGWLRSNPTEFFIASKVGPGKASRDVIPGIWSEVYDRVTGVVREQASRWKRA